MSYEEPEVRFPAPDFLRAGPPVAVRDLHRQASEKWARVVVVCPRQREGARELRYDFVRKGPFTLPLAVRRAGVDLGSKDAWRFFTHPYSVFPPDAAFYNVPGPACLGARLFVRGAEGVRLYDEVGANLEGAERVVEDFAGALGVLRQRALSEGDARHPLAPDLLETDTELLLLFHLFTSLLKSSTPLRVLAEVYRMLQRPTLRNFAWDLFDEREQALMQAVTEGDEGELTRSPIRFRVDESDFTQITDVTDARGRQAILELLQEWEAFEAQHKDRLAELALGIQEQEGKLEAIKARVRELQQAPERRGLTALFARDKTKALRELKAEAVVVIRAKRKLEDAFAEIPGYERVRGLSDRVKGFEKLIASVYGLARDMDDYNVSRAEVGALQSLAWDRVLSPDEETSKSGWRAYDLRLRAELLPKVLMTHAISAYVLRRPEALRGQASRRNLERVNLLARRLIEYFRAVRYGSKSTFGEEFDSTWGQVIAIEERL